MHPSISQLLPLVFSILPQLISGSEFHKQISHIEISANKAFHDSLVAQLADSRNVSAPPLAVNLDAVMPLGLSSFAEADSAMQIYLPSTLPTTPAPSQGCADALLAPLQCNETIQLMSITPFALINDLPTVCTSECTASLASYRAGVVSACTGYHPTSNGISFPPTYAVDVILGPYTVQCLQDPQTSTFCAPLLMSLNTTGGLLALPESELCDFCPLETLNRTLSNPATYSNPLAQVLSGALDICGPEFSSFNVSSAPTSPISAGPDAQFGSNTTIPVTNACVLTGRNITTTSGSTCAQIASQYNVSDNDVLVSNPILDVGCAIAADTQLCIPQACQTYTIAINDTCDSVAQLAGSRTGVNITTVQLQSFNPELGTYCQLMALRVGQKICLTPNGGFPTVGATTNANPSATPTATAPIPTPTAPGTTSDCGKYYQVQPGDVCNTVILNNTISLPDFVIMNPEIDANCSNLWLNYYYCVAPFPPLASISATPIVTATNFSTATVFSYSIPPNYTPTLITIAITEAGVPAPTNVANGTREVACGYYYTVEDGDTLDSIADDVGITSADLIGWNPELSSAPPEVDSAICIVFPRGNYTLAPAPTPVNIAPNTTTDCTQFYTIVSGDSCPSIEAKFGLTNTQFHAMNPGINSDCTNIILGVAYCVFPTTPLVQPSSNEPPDNVAPGTITDGCTMYYTVVSGDSCPAIEDQFNLTLSQFITMNPEINSVCSNLALGEAYCVASSNTTTTPTGPPENVAPGTITEGCTDYYTVVSGDSCTTIDSQFNLTTPQFITMNPEINSICSNLVLGLAYCVQSSNTTSSGPPPNLATGSLANCTSYHTVVSGDTCTAMDAAASIALADFLRWNPEINNDCTNILLDEAYCVGGGGSACGTVYTVQSGDSCSGIVSSQGITQAQLNALNPQIDEACDNLGVGENLCVG